MMQPSRQDRLVTSSTRSITAGLTTPILPLPRGSLDNPPVSEAIGVERLSWPERIRATARPIHFQNWWDQCRPGSEGGVFSNTKVPSWSVVSISGPTINSVARCLIELLTHIHRVRGSSDVVVGPFRAPSDCSCANVHDFKAFMCEVRLYLV
jgi:hypothetical protein